MHLVLSNVKHANAPGTLDGEFEVDHLQLNGVVIKLGNGHAVFVFAATNKLHEAAMFRFPEGPPISYSLKLTPDEKRAVDALRATAGPIRFMASDLLTLIDGADTVTVE